MSEPTDAGDQEAQLELGEGSQMDLSADFQLKLAAAVLSGDPRMVPTLDLVAPEHFSLPGLSIIWEHIRRIAQDCGHVPTRKLLREELWRSAAREPSEREFFLALLKKTRRIVPEVEVAYLIKHVQEFAHMQQILIAYRDAIPFIERRDLKAVEEVLGKALQGGAIRGDNLVTLTLASSVRPEHVKWAWAGRIPLGAVSLIVGVPGLGKSTIACDLAARLTRGELEGDLEGAPAAALIATAEDPIGPVVLPRLMAARANLELVYLVNVKRDGVEGDLSLPNDLDRLRARIEEVHAKLLVIDPLVAHIPATLDSHRDQHVRRVLAPLRRVAEDLDIAIVCTLHLNKRETSDVLTKIGGSVGLGAAARSVLLLGEDPHDADSTDRILAHAKSNVGPKAVSVRLRVEGRTVEVNDGDRIKTSAIAWRGDATDVKAEDLIAPRDNAGDTAGETKAVGILRDMLRAGPVPADEAERTLTAAGVKEGAWRRAKKLLDVTSIKTGFKEGWLWALPEHAKGNDGDLGATPSSPSTPSTSSSTGQSPHTSSTTSSSSSSSQPSGTTSKVSKASKTSKMPCPQGHRDFAPAENGIAPALREKLRRTMEEIEERRRRKRTRRTGRSLTLPASPPAAADDLVRVEAATQRLESSNGTRPLEQDRPKRPKVKFAKAPSSTVNGAGTRS
jgi:hypothetical protein